MPASSSQASSKATCGKTQQRWCVSAFSMHPRVAGLIMREASHAVMHLQVSEHHAHHLPEANLLAQSSPEMLRPVVAETQIAFTGTCRARHTPSIPCIPM